MLLRSGRRRRSPAASHRARKRNWSGSPAPNGIAGAIPEWNKFTQSYQAMLDQHRWHSSLSSNCHASWKDFPLEFESLSGLAADIEHHLNAADQIYQECMAAAA